MPDRNQDNNSCSIVSVTLKTLIEDSKIKELKETINTLRSIKQPGPDKIFPEFLKKKTLDLKT